MHIPLSPFRTNNYNHNILKIILENSKFSYIMDTDQRYRWESLIEQFLSHW